MKQTNLKIVLAAALVGAVFGASLALRKLPRPGLDFEVLAHKQFLLAAVVGWCAFSLYWEAAAKNAAPAKSSEAAVSRGFHVGMVNLAALLVLFPLQGFGRWLPATPLVMCAGLAIQALGTVLAVWSRRHLGRNWSGAIQIKENPELVRSGPYRVLRHPIYTGLLAMYIGPAIVTGEWLGVAGVALAIAAYWRKIRLEEATLRVAFGEAYEKYARNSWALIPGLY
jgi:protein-S-isoprenylcysteine O-methyltransferase Ste14